MIRTLKKIVIALMLLPLLGLLVFARDDYDTMENWEWEYRRDTELTFWKDLLGLEPADVWSGVRDGLDRSWFPGTGWNEAIFWGNDSRGEEEDHYWDDEDDGWDEWEEEEEEGWEDWEEEEEEEDDDWDDWEDEDEDEDEDWDDWDDDDDDDDEEEDGPQELPDVPDDIDPENPPEGPTGGDSIPEEDENEDLRTRNIRILARLIFGEARGVDSRVEQAAVAWCALNRLDAGDLSAEDLPKIVNSSHFGGYDKSDPVYPHHWDLAESVYDAWEEEKTTGKLSSLRVLPKEYLYYWGTRTHNWFVTDKTYIGSKRKAWSFSSRDPYASARRYHLKHYTPSDEEIDMMTQVLHHKARGVESEMERAAVIWCILNRVQSPLYEDTVRDVLLHEGQFSTYDPDLEPRGSLRRLVEDVVERWCREMDGRTDVGRVLPEEYLYFKGDGEYNYFYIKPNSDDEWDWSLENPYDD